ncbi:MAG TPA: hypothetical protein VFW33_07685, partial [Gemmataceae bacterium]|nr:hypothetical protein [Gemmataceae bacterium]
MDRLHPCGGLRLLLGLVASCALSGCAAVTNPLADGVPVRRLPPELLAPPRDLHPVALNLLGQPKPDAYRLAPGDVLGIYVEGVLGDHNQP